MPRSSRRSQAGLTLVEVLAAVMLLGTVLVSGLMASARQRGQAADAERRLEACRIADELLAQWWSDPEGMPAADQGIVPGRGGWRWRTEVVRNGEAQVLNAQVVALTVFGGDVEAPPLVRIEVLRPREDQRAPQG